MYRDQIVMAARLLMQIAVQGQPVAAGHVHVSALLFQKTAGQLSFMPVLFAREGAAVPWDQGPCP